MNCTHLDPNCSNARLNRARRIQCSQMIDGRWFNWITCRTKEGNGKECVLTLQTRGIQFLFQLKPQKKSHFETEFRRQHRRPIEICKWNEMLFMLAKLTLIFIMFYMLSCLCCSFVVIVRYISWWIKRIRVKHKTLQHRFEHTKTNEPR